MALTQRTRPISWIKAALREFETFPEEARSIFLSALTIAAEGGKADIAKPMHGIGSGVLEIALSFRANAFRVVYAVQVSPTCECPLGAPCISEESHPGHSYPAT